jgi:Glu-tRNA(Gln) amidotransferase subunit E-like FAD-binding protein
VVVFWVEQDDAPTATREILLRAAEASVGIPAETRQAHRGGTTGFERILPGADRMYPDTDTPPLPIDDRQVDRIRATLPERPWARADRYHALGLSPAAAERLAVAPWAAAFDAASPPAGDLARRLAATLAKRVPYHIRRGRPIPSELGPALIRVVEIIRGSGVRIEALDRLVDDALTRPDVSTDELLARYRAGSPPPERVFEEVAGRARALPGRSAETRLRWAMGEAMRALIGRVDPATVLQQLAARLTPAAARKAS